jgi:hypothetical protein
MRAHGRSESEIASAVSKNAVENETILQLLGAEDTEGRASLVAEGYTVFGDNLEAELSGWRGFTDEVRATMLAQGGWAEKSYDNYREAAATTPAAPPAIFESLLERVHALSG